MWLYHIYKTNTCLSSLRNKVVDIKFAGEKETTNNDENTEVFHVVIAFLENLGYSEFYFEVFIEFEEN